MEEFVHLWSERVLAALEKMAREADATIGGAEEKLSVSRPPRSDMGDLSFPLFAFAKDFKQSPPSLASRAAEALGGQAAGAVAVGPYLNIRIDRPAAIRKLFSQVAQAGDNWGRGDELSGRRVMMEFSSPNTNKPLHLGHLRNDIIGESCARILAARGADVCKVNLINDRGIHICQSMLAYQEFGQGQTPEDHGVKSDRFVGDFYVKYCQWAAENDEAESRAKALLLKWESGDRELMKLWNRMNNWALSGINATYQRTGVSFDLIYRESETYLLGREVVLEGLEKGVFYKHPDGSVRMDMEEIGMDTKVLLRGDGTSVYITQDLGTVISRQDQWPFDELIYVVGDEQDYHFRVLFFILKKLGFPWASRLRHLSYGMVNLPSGKMKSREGTTADADDLIDELSELALEEIRSKDRVRAVGDARETADKIALAALHYFLLRVSPSREMMFNPEESLAFNGNTGPYLQYMVARIAGLIAKASADVSDAEVDAALLTRDDEWELCRRIADYPSLVAQSAEKLDPSIMAVGLYETARDFSRYYHEVPIAKAQDVSLAASRMALSCAVLTTLRSGFALLNIPYIEVM